MMLLYDEEEIMRSYIESKKYETNIETAKRFLKMGKISKEEIAAGTGLPIEEIEKLAKLQLA